MSARRAEAAGERSAILTGRERMTLAALKTSPTSNASSTAALGGALQPTTAGRTHPIEPRRQVQGVGPDAALSTRHLSSALWLPSLTAMSKVIGSDSKLRA